MDRSLPSTRPNNVIRLQTTHYWQHHPTSSTRAATFADRDGSLGTGYYLTHDESRHTAEPSSTKINCVIECVRHLHETLTACDSLKTVSDTSDRLSLAFAAWSHVAPSKGRKLMRNQHFGRAPAEHAGGLWVGESIFRPPHPTPRGRRPSRWPSRPASE
jgi:hypothetical protein